jgi:uncharacterized Zn finger protein
MSREGVRRVEYKCSKCGAVDHVLLFSHEATPPVANCWKCGAGRKTPDISEAIQKRIGMFPVEGTALAGAV